MRVTFKKTSGLDQAKALSRSAHLLPTREPTHAHRMSASPIDMPEHLAPLFAAVAIINLPHLKVLDVGGALGGHLAYLESSLTIGLDWTVLELPAYANYGNSYIENENIRFISTEPPEGFDLIYFSGSLQFPDRWQDLALHKNKGTFVLITRTPFAEKEAAFLQNVQRDGISYSLPYRVLPKDEFMSFMNSTHSLIASWSNTVTLCEARSLTNPFPRREEFQSPSMLFRRTNP